MQQRSVLETQLKQAQHIDIGWPWRLFLLSFVLCILSVALYAGMRFAYIPYLDASIHEADAAVEALQQEVSANVSTGLINFYSQIVNIQSLLDPTRALSPLLFTIEKATHRSAYLNSFSFDDVAHEVKFSGVAPSSDILSEQLARYHAVPEFHDFTVHSASFDDKNRVFLFEVGFTVASSSLQ